DGNRDGHRDRDRSERNAAPRRELAPVGAAAAAPAAAPAPAAAVTEAPAARVEEPEISGRTRRRRSAAS
ncbi:MAG: hypothetical protein ACO28M_07235, partial [Vulcanococcus sp.]